MNIWWNSMIIDLHNLQHPSTSHLALLTKYSEKNLPPTRLWCFSGCSMGICPPISIAWYGTQTSIWDHFTLLNGSHATTTDHHYLDELPEAWRVVVPHLVTWIGNGDTSCEVLYLQHNRIVGTLSKLPKKNNWFGLLKWILPFQV